MKRLLWSTGVALRDGLLILTLVGVGILALEATYRAQAGVRAWFRPPPPPSPLERTPWGPDLLAEEAEAEVSWSPYVQTRAAPRQGTHLNVDRFGQRVTVNPTPRKAERPLRAYLLGGSTAFGTGQRDVGTLASALARRLASVCEGV